VISRELREFIWTVHPFGTRVRNPQRVGIFGIGKSEFLRSKGLGHHKSRNPDEIRAARLWGRVAEIQAIGESPDEEAVHRSLAHRDIGDPGDKLSVPFGIAKREIPMSGG
jgi:hypothetical protein